MKADAHFLRPLFLVLPLLLLPGCTARVGGGSGTELNQIGRDQLSQYSTILDAVQALRGNWLRERTSVLLSNEPAAPPFVGADFDEANPIWVYRDGTRIGDVTMLNRVATVEIELVEFIEAREASQRWGPNHENGVIHLTSR